MAILNRLGRHEITARQHGFLGDSIGPLSTDTMTLAELLRDRHYATAAFTEGETSAGGDLTYHTGFERGFDLFDPSYAPPIEAFGEDDGEMPASGSQVTLQKARAWIQNHSDVKFFLFLRLRELEEVRHREQYGKAFLEDPENPGPVDVYDNAIAYMDRQIGALIEYVRDRPIKDTTCIVITSLYGYDVDPMGDPPVAVTLNEPSVHVPLIFYVPGLDRRRRGDLVGLEDVAPTIARVARTSFPHPIAGKDFLSGAIHRRPVSMGGEPLTLSIRTPKWRFAWRPGTVPSEAS
ncbi:MAG: sulfatase-like hydrolase/transferase, partial [Planctomycetes bacterium]|nr:sulfatase-like hydrolase/transferase [Planctomycetota bacterium]